MWLVENSLKNAYIWEYNPPKRTPTAYTIGYWELDGNGEDTKNDYWITTYTTTDYDSDGYSWAWNPTYTSWRLGKQCAYFDGTRCLNLPVLPIPSNTLTFSLRVKPNSSCNSALFWHRQDLSSSNSWWCVNLGRTTNSSGALYCSWVGTTNSTWTSWQTGYDFNNVTVTSDERHHMAFTFSWWTAKFYVDGVLKQTMTWKAWLRNSNSTRSFIGWAVNYSWNNYGIAYIQDVIYENRTWSDQDVADYYANY